MNRGRNWTEIATIIDLFDEVNILILFMVLLIAQAMSRECLRECKWRPAAKLAAWGCFVLYGIHLATFLDFRDDVFEMMMLIVRAAVVSAIVFHVVLLPVTFFVHFIVRFLEEEWHRFCELGEKLSAEHEKRKRVVPIEVIPEPPQPPREDLIQHDTQHAKLDLQFELEIIEAAGLDADEKEAAITEARKKYLGRLRSALQ